MFLAGELLASNRWLAILHGHSRGSLRNQGVPLRYGIAVLAVGISTAISLGLRPQSYLTPYLFFYPAILVSLWLGGLGAGLLATVFTAVLVDYFLIQPYYILFHAPIDIVRAVYFCASFGLICWLIDRRQYKAEAKIQRQAEALELANDAILILDLDGKIEFWNRGAERLYGWTREEAMQRRAQDLLQTRFPVSLPQIVKQAWQLGEWQGELRQTTRTGKQVLVASRWNPRFDFRGELAGTFEVNRDITGHRQTEHALQTAEKLATVGRLTSTIVHEINNPLGALENLVYLLQENPSLDESAREYLELARAELAQMAQISRYTLSLTRDAIQPVSVDIAQLVEEISELYSRRREFRGIAIARVYDTHDTVLGYPGEIRQVISNLIVNACEAAGQAGKVKIHVLGSRDWRTPAEAGIRLFVANSGSAISRENRHRIFEPFFTTKGERGNGLGLWVSHNVVMKHKGSITVKSCSDPQAESWTFFSVFFPFRGPSLWNLEPANSAHAG
jgi:PAS domain S-box-containing protein